MSLGLLQAWLGVDFGLLRLGLSWDGLRVGQDAIGLAIFRLSFACSRVGPGLRLA